MLDRAIKLVHGEGSPETGACWMSAIRMYEGGSWGDRPDCVCPVIRNLCVALNDSFGEGAEADRLRGEFIGPHLFDVVGTRAGLETMLKRSFLCADRAVRVFAPIGLRAAGLEAEAAKLGALQPITDQETARAASYAARAASYAASAASDWRRMTLQLILDCCAIDDKRPVEAACSESKVREFCGAKT